MFKPDAPGWVARDRGYGGPASGNWSSALAGEASWSNYALDCRLALVRPADRRDGMELGAFVAFANHAQLGGYEAGLILRYQSPNKFYRVAVSSLWKEVIVWRPSGGVVQAVDFPFEAGKTYHLIAQCRGPRIVVEVGGKPLIDWWDTADPIESGKAGLARKEGESYFAAVKIDRLEAPAGKAPVHAPQFRQRAWHNLRFFFDNNEPIFTLKDDNYLDLMKLRPGYRPILYTGNFVHDNALLSANKVNRYRLVNDGSQLVIETTGADPKGKRVIELRGKSSYVWPLSSPNLTFAPPTTLVVRLKPEAPGNLLFWDFNYHLIGSGPKFGIGYQLNTLHGKPRGPLDAMVASTPFLQAGKWQTLAIVAADDRIKLYCDGKLFETLAAELKAGNWGPLAMDDGQGVHRRLSFFGSGPGDALKLASDEIPLTGGGLKGRIARLTVYRRALGEQEIAKLAHRPAATSALP